ncbi:MAG: glycosyltransferase family 2 protein [Candidatus Berkelbacteria bacterium]|nr:glycosyltransferase family 2 protein [Candidatus Berkelbacteria bacterium]
MSEQPFLSVIIPAYKEEQRIHKILEAIEKYQADAKFVTEILVVLDGSPDDTLAATKKFEGRVKNLKIIDRKENKGKGLTVSGGMLKATGKYRIFADADNSTPFHQVDRLLDYVLMS